MLISFLAINQFLMANCETCEKDTNCPSKDTNCPDKTCGTCKCEGSETPCKDEITMTGMFVCPHFLMAKEEDKMPDTQVLKECIVKCTEAGEPLLFVDDKGNIYLSLFCCKCNLSKKEIAGMGMEKVSIKGCIIEKGGLKAVEICLVSETKE